MEIRKYIFFHPDFTVGIGIAPIQRLRARGLYRRSGITPCPEDILFWFLRVYHPGDFLSRKEKCATLYSLAVLLSSGVAGVVVDSVAVGFFSPWTAPLAAVLVISPPMI